MCCSAKCGSVCPYCSYDVCRGCTRRYLLELTTNARCMNCSKLWNHENIETICGISFSNGPYKKHRVDLLFEREKALFPATQPLVTRFLRREELWKLQSEITIRMQLNKIYPKHPEFKECSENLLLIQQALNSLDRTVTVQKESIPTRKCPCADCKGFLDKSWLCQICTTQICKKCNEPAKSNHTCDPGAVETMKLLKEDTKGCPSCGCMISKIAGCSQMWCVECHTTFDWKTLEIEKGVVHNPHYFEYMRKNGGLARQPGDEPCGGGLPGIHELIHMPYSIAETVRKAIHFQQIGLMRIPQPLTMKHGDTLEKIRMQYMMNRLTEEKYRSLLCKQDKHGEKMNELTQVRDMYVNVLGDLVRDFANHKDMDVFNKSHAQLKEFTQAAFKKISVRFGCVEIVCN